MARYAYDRLTALDNSFLLLEGPNACMHVASTQVFDAGPLRKPDGGIDADAIKAAVAAGLHLIPRYRQKLAYVPILDQPVWVDDDQFNLDFHIRHTSLPRPGDDEQLKRLSARIMQQRLDRSRPLWEIWVVEGLDENRFALVSKVHHCMIDGISGVDLMKILMSPTPEYELPEPLPYIPRRTPSGIELLRHELMRRAALPLSVLRGVRDLATEAQDVRREIVSRARAVASTLGTTLHFASATPFNHEIGPNRRFDWLTMDLAQIKEARRQLGGTLNDVVLTVVTGAVRRFLERRHVDPGAIDFRVMTPVSVRNDDERGQLGNRVSAWVVELPVRERDPRRQLERIRKRTAELKDSKQAVGAEVLTQVAEWTPSTLLALGARNSTRLLAFNMVVTNVPGPQFPMYMVGARMLEAYPLVPLLDRLGLGIALLSYDGKLCWGFNADYDLLPDLSAFVQATRDSFDELRVLAGASSETASRQTPPTPLDAKPRRARRRRARANGAGEVPPPPGLPGGE